MPESVVDAYFAEIAALEFFGRPPLHIVYTAMHGVGRLAVERALVKLAITMCTVWLNKEIPILISPRWPFRIPRSLGRWT